MSYDTGNPIGSKDPRDLYDNATNFDKYSVGEDPMYVDRLGNQKLTIEGQQQAFSAAQDGRDEQFQAALIATGFQDLGNYAAGLTITARNQVFARNGVYYSASASLPLPYTLTGNWAAEGSNFTLRADAPLRSDLAAAGGATMIGRPSGQTVGSDLDALAAAVAATNNTVANLAVRFKVAPADTSTLRTLALTDASNILQLTNPASKIVAIPAQATVAWPADTAIGLFNDSATSIQITVASGVTLKVIAGGNAIIPKGGLCFLKRMSSDVWLVMNQVTQQTPIARVKAFGDSITVGLGASSPVFAYLNRETEMVKVPFVNNAVSSATAWDQAAQVLATANIIDVNEAAQLMIGTNDSRAYGTAIANNLDTFKRSHAALLAWMAIPEASKIRATDARITYTGTWGDNASAYSGLAIKQATAAGSVATFTFTGTTFYVASSRTITNTNASATVRVDGAVVGTITKLGYTANTPLGGTYGPALYRFSGLSNTAHTVTITTDVAGNPNTFFLDWVGFPSAANSRLVNNINIPRQTAAGGGVDATTAAYNQGILDNINMLVGDGLRINLADVTPTFNPATDLAADGLHPNDAGHLKIATLATESLLR